MKTRTTVLLLLVVAALSGYVLFFDKGRPSTRQQNENALYLAQVDQAKITGMDITNGDSVIKLRKDDGKWMLVAPVKDQANAATVSAILSKVSSLGRSSVVDNLAKDKIRSTQKEYGVQKGKVRLKLLGAGVPGEIHFGKDTAFEGKIYARLETDENISIIPVELRNLLTKDVADFRDRRLTRFETSKVSRVKFKTSAGEIDLLQTGDDWNLQTPIKARAANAKVLDLISSVNNLMIQEFITPDEASLAKYGLAEPRGALSFTSRDDDQAETIEIGSPTEKDPEKIYLRVSDRPSIFVVPKSVGVALGARPNDLRDNKLTRVSSDLIDRLTIEKPGQAPLVLARQEEHWKILEGNQPASDEAIQRVIDVLNNTETKAFVDDTAADLKTYALDQPVLTVRMSSFSTENTAEAGKGETPLATVQFGRTEGDVIYARLAEEPFVVSVGSGILAGIPTTVEGYQQPAARATPSPNIAP